MGHKAKTVNGTRVRQTVGTRKGVARVVQEFSADARASETVDIPAVRAGRASVVRGIGGFQSRASWFVAYSTTLAVFGLPYGSAYVPCYLCAHPVDAWRAHREHLVPETKFGPDGRPVWRVGDVLMAHSTCNAGKAQRTATRWHGIVADVLADRPGVAYVPAASDPALVAAYRARDRDNGRDGGLCPCEDCGH